MPHNPTKNGGELGGVGEVKDSIQEGGEVRQRTLELSERVDFG